ncbi:MAG: hypothetical protein RLZZ367_1690 [Bacteroidota bacterium]|jgi:hypothetical protein
MSLTGLPKLFYRSLLVIVPVLAFWQVSLFCNTMKWDTMVQFFPCRFLMSEAFNEHNLPLWNPYINFGYPAYADPQGGFFYPITWLFAALFGYNTYTIAAEFVLHIVIAAITCYALLRVLGIGCFPAVVMGITYSLSGIFVSNATHLTWVISMAWLPAVLAGYKMLLEKPSLLHALLLAVATYLFLVGGYPAFFIIVAYFIAGYTLYFIANTYKMQGPAICKLCLWSTVAAITFLILCSGYIFSTVQTLPLIDRGEGLTVQRANTFPLSPQAMLSFVFPFATACRNYSLGTDITMANVYCGIFVFPLIILALIKVRLPAFTKALLVFGVICLLASAGESTPVRSWLYLLPGFDMFRHAAIFRVFTTLAFIVTAAAGLQWWWQQIEKLQSLTSVRYSILFYTVLLVIVFVVIDIMNHGFIAYPKQWSFDDFTLYNEKQTVYTHILAQCISHFVALFVLAVTTYIKNTRIAKAIVASVLIADMAFALQLNVPATVIAGINPHKLQQALNNAEVDFIPLSKQPIEDFSHLGTKDIDPVWFNASIFRKVPACNGFNNFELKGMAQLRDSSLYKDIISHPYCYFAAAQGTTADTATTYHVKRFTMLSTEVNYTAARGTNVVLLQNTFPGWSLNCDGTPLPISKQYGYFIKAVVPAGNHTLCFEFKPIMPVIFWGITVAGFILTIATITLLLVRHKYFGNFSTLT